ncbi:MFS transporter [Bombiscardovia nodaiensis]|uniref:MFS transporter n=1 Tax=Bombiscardovia nodaiensis TaxID=2932181 RepID=A0ABM8BA95_9BIFI|nr:MFS transporter [Bombiscardovia nodaiensis]
MSVKRTNVIFGTLLCGAIVTSLLQTALTTALPAIMAELHLGASTAQWLTSAFSLTMAIMVPATAYLIKRFSTRQIFSSAMFLFTLGTFFAWVAPSFPLLLTGRILQALGSGIILPLLQVVVMTMYPPEKQGFVMGIYGLAAGAAPVFAPTLAGFLIGIRGWRSIFLVTLIPSALTLILSLVTINNVSETEKIPFDYLSMVLCALGMTGLLLGLGNLTSGGLPTTVLPLLLGLLACVFFVRRQLKLSQPFLDVRAFSDRNFRLAVIISVLLYAVMMGGSTIYPILIQTVMGKSAVVSALVMLPGSLIMSLISPRAGRFYDRFGIRALVLAGSLIMLVSCLGVSFVHSSTDIALLVALYALRLFAVGCIMMTIVTWGMQKLPASQVTHGSALLTSLRTLAGAFGSAVSMEIMSYASQASVAHQVANYAGVRVAFLSISALAFVQLLVALAAFGAHSTHGERGSGC